MGDAVAKYEDVPPENCQDMTMENSQQPSPGVLQEAIPPNVDQQPKPDTETSHKIEVPNNKVHVCFYYSLLFIRLKFYGFLNYIMR